MEIIIITFIIIAVVILGGLWYLGWLRKCYDKHQAGNSAPKLVLERIAKSHQNCKIYDERRAAVKRYMLLITFCTLILGGGAYFVDAKYEQWSADFKQWKVERAERKAQAELQKQKEERLEAERKAEEAAKARKRQEAEKLRAEQLKKQQEAEQLKAEKSQSPTDKFFSFTKNYFAYFWEQGIIATFFGGVFYLLFVLIILGTLYTIWFAICLLFRIYD